MFKDKLGTNKLWRVFIDGALPARTARSAFRAGTSADQLSIEVGFSLAGGPAGGCKGVSRGCAERPRHTRLARTGGETNLCDRLPGQTVTRLAGYASLCLPSSVSLSLVPCLLNLSSFCLPVFPVLPQIFLLFASHPFSFSSPSRSKLRRLTSGQGRPSLAGEGRLGDAERTPETCPLRT